MKVVIAGGSSQSTPCLLCDDRLAPLSGNLEFWLLGRSTERLNGVKRAAYLLGCRATVHCMTIYDNDLPRALDAADVVLVQARYGGYRAREYDETFPHRYGMCGDEGLGPGGLAAAWRTWPQLSRLLDEILRCCRRANVVLMTAPVSILMRCIRLKYPSLAAAGICELPWTTLRVVCEAVGADLDQVGFDYVGTNHVGWFYRIICGSRDLVAEYASSLDGGGGFPTQSLIQTLGAVPLKYLRLHYCSQTALEDQLAQAPRARVLEELDHRASQRFAENDAEAIRAILSLRPTPWYSNAVAPLIAGWLGASVTQKLFLSMCNQYHETDLMPSDVIEIPCQFVGGKLVRRPNLTKPPAHIRRALHDFMRYERAAASAVVERDSSSLEWAISQHPWLPEPAAAAAIAADVRAGALTTFEARPLLPVTSYCSN